MAPFRQHLNLASTGYPSELVASLAFVSSPFVGAIVGARIGWSHGWLATVGGLFAGVPIGLLAGAAVAVAAFVGPMIYFATLSYALDCFLAVDRGLRPEWMRLRNPDGSEQPAFSLWCLPFIVALGSIPFGAFIWTAIQFIPRRKHHPGLPDVIAPTVTISFAVTLAVVTAVGVFLILRANTHARRLWERVQARAELPPGQRPFLLVPISCALLTTPIVALALLIVAALEFFTKAQRLASYPWGLYAAEFAVPLAVMFLTACGMEARERWGRSRREAGK